MPTTTAITTTAASSLPASKNSNKVPLCKRQNKAPMFLTLDKGNAS